MQTFEFLTLIFFLLPYITGALRAILMPEQYRNAEIRFYQSGKPHVFQWFTFGFNGLALVFLILHFLLETAQAAQILLYAMVILYELMIPFHFMPFFRDRMVSSLKQKSNEKYRRSGLNHIGIAVVIILLPVLFG